MIDTDKYEGHQPAPWRWVKPMGMKEWFLYAEQGNHSVLNHQRAGGIWLPDTFCRLGVGLDPTHRDEKSTYDLLQDAPLLLAEVKQLREQYTELREALVGDSPNWTHEELIERALEMSEPAELEFGEWHTDIGEEE